MMETDIAGMSRHWISCNAVANSLCGAHLNTRTAVEQIRLALLSAASRRHTSVGGSLNCIEQRVKLGVESHCEGTVHNVPIDLGAKICRSHSRMSTRSRQVLPQ